MNTQTAFVGDVHGNLAALRGMWRVLENLETISNVVFLGDYINKGAFSAEVLAELHTYRASGSVTLLKGNHEGALLEAIDREDLRAFLKIGGAMTIQSYVRRPVAPNVFKDFMSCLPAHHLEMLREMAESYETDEVSAQHIHRAIDANKFQVSAHVPIGVLPKVDHQSAQLDTGCGSPTGRLTAFLWPDRTFVQVGANGLKISGPEGPGNLSACYPVRA